MSKPSWKDALKPSPDTTGQEETMTDETMTFPQVLRAMAENVEEGKVPGYGIEYRLYGEDCSRRLMPYPKLSEVSEIISKGSISRASRAEAERRLFGKEDESNG